MTTKTQVLVTRFIVQFENSIQPPQWNAPVVLQHATVVVDEQGVVQYQASFSERPASAQDVTDEMVEYLSRRLSAVGLTVSRTENVV